MQKWSTHNQPQGGTSHLLLPTWHPAKNKRYQQLSRRNIFLSATIISLPACLSTNAHVSCLPDANVSSFTWTTAVTRDATAPTTPLLRKRGPSSQAGEDKNTTDRIWRLPLRLQNADVRHEDVQHQHHCGASVGKEEGKHGRVDLFYLTQDVQLAHRQSILCNLLQFLIPLEQNSSIIKLGTVTKNDFKIWTPTMVPRPPLLWYSIRMDHSISGLTHALTSTVNFPLSSSERRGSSWGWSLTIPSFRRVSCQKQKIAGEAGRRSDCSTPSARAGILSREQWGHLPAELTHALSGILSTILNKASVD